MAQIHRDILDNWKATDWKVHSVTEEGVTTFSLYDENGKHVVTNTLLYLSNNGHDKGNIEKDYSTDTF